MSTFQSNSHPKVVHQVCCHTRKNKLALCLLFITEVVLNYRAFWIVSQSRLKT